MATGDAVVRVQVSVTDVDSGGRVKCVPVQNHPQATGKCPGSPDSQSATDTH